MFDYSYTTLTLRDAIKEDPHLLDNLSLSTLDRTTEFKNMFMAVYRMRSIGAETVELFKIWIQDRFDEFKKYYEDVLDVYEKELSYDDGIVITKNETEESSETGNNSLNKSESISDTGNETYEKDGTESLAKTGNDTMAKTGTEDYDGSTVDDGTQKLTGGRSIVDEKENYDLPNRQASVMNKGYLSSVEKNTEGVTYNNEQTDIDNSRTIDDRKTYNTLDTTTYNNTDTKTYDTTDTKRNSFSRTASGTNTGESSKDVEKENNVTIKGNVNVIEQRDKMIKYIRNIYREFCLKFNDCFSMIYA